MNQNYTESQADRQTERERERERRGGERETDAKQSSLGMFISGISPKQQPTFVNRLLTDKIILN